MTSLNVGQNIKLFRENLGIKQKDLAEQLGVSVNYLSLLEHNNREPSLAFLKRISKAMKVPITFFLIDSIQNNIKVNPNLRRAVAKLRALALEMEKLKKANGKE